jgi:hypothetical protein
MMRSAATLVPGRGLRQPPAPSVRATRLGAPGATLHAQATSESFECLHVWLRHFTALDASGLLRADPVDLGPPKPALEAQTPERSTEAGVLRDAPLLCPTARLRIELEIV